MTRRRLPAAGPNDDQGPLDRGVSLVEVLVGLGLFGMLSTVLLGFAMGTSQVTEDTRQLAGVNEEARLAMERLTRELRQADEVRSFQPPATAGSETAFTFWTDFNGDSSDYSASDPEVLTYRWRPDGGGQLTLTAGSNTQPVLAANVSAFEVGLNSSLWEYDANHDGTTTWRELDVAGSPVGDNTSTPTAPELSHVDQVTISMTVLDGAHAQTYRTQVDLRNQN